MRFIPLALLFLLTALHPSYAAEPNDPLEPLNRFSYHFTDALDTMLISPASNAYNKLTPQPLQGIIESEIAFLSEPRNLVNHLLILNQEDFSTTFGRILINGILGLGGLFDIASVVGINQQDNDFGLTLKKYGIGTGPYIYIPITGPSSLRDSIGFGADYFSDPYNLKATEPLKIARAGITLLDKRYKIGDNLNALGSISLDKYITQRSIYFQKRGELELDEDF